MNDGTLVSRYRALPILTTPDGTFAKALASAAPKPGFQPQNPNLVKKKITDKRGHATSRWVNPNTGQPAPQNRAQQPAPAPQAPAQPQQVPQQQAPQQQAPVQAPPVAPPQAPAPQQAQQQAQQAPQPQAAPAPAPAPAAPAPAPTAAPQAQQAQPPAPRRMVSDPGIPKPREYTPIPGQDPKEFVDNMVRDHAEYLKFIKENYGAHTLEHHAVITMGLPASGKSTYLNKHHMKYGQYLHIDVDALKKLHPDYDPDHPELVHKFSKQAEAYLFKTALEAGVPVMLDTTGGNWKKWGERIQTLRDAGYKHVGLSYVRVSEETSRKRNAERERHVPAEVIDEVMTEFNPNTPGNEGITPFQRLAPLVDKVHVLDHEDDEFRAKRAVRGWQKYIQTAKQARAKQAQEAAQQSQQAAAPQPQAAPQQPVAKAMRLDKLPRNMVVFIRMEVP